MEAPHWGASDKYLQHIISGVILEGDLGEKDSLPGWLIPILSWQRNENISNV